MLFPGLCNLFSVIETRQHLCVIRYTTHVSKSLWVTLQDREPRYEIYVQSSKMKKVNIHLFKTVCDVMFYLVLL